MDDAKTLIDKNQSITGSINRSYYAAFYAGLALLQTIGKGSSKHSGVIALLHQNFFRSEILPRENGRIINRLFELRQKSDYEVAPPVDTSTAAESLEAAIRFTEVIRQYLTKQDWL